MIAVPMSMIRAGAEVSRATPTTLAMRSTPRLCLSYRISASGSGVSASRVTKRWQMLLTESSQGWRGTAKYYIDFGDGYAIGVYKNEPYCYIGTGVYEQDGYLMLSGDPGISKGFDIQEDAHEYLLDVVDGLLKENR